MAEPGRGRGDGKRLRLGDDAARRPPAGGAGRALRDPRRLGPPHAGPAVPLRRGGGGTRAPLHHRGRRRSGPPPGMLAAKTALPIFGVPVPTKHLQGLDSLLSIVQMPAGVPVATFAIGAAGAQNAALCAAAVLALSDAGAGPAAGEAPAGADPAGPRPPVAAGARVILPGATLGVLGGGQLGRMFVLRARTMGYGVVVLDPDPAQSRRPGGRRSPPGRLHRPRCARPARRRLRRRHHRVRERPRGGARAAGALLPGAPAGRRRWRWRRTGSARRRFLERARLPHGAVPPGAERRRSCAPPLRAVQLPALLKTSRLGYDGKGQATDRARRRTPPRRSPPLGRVACVLEERLALETELSVVLARGDDGAVAAFPVGENRHRDGILETTVVPARVSREPRRTRRATRRRRVADALDYVGVLGVELFVANGGRIFVNEIAPRPHNSGHYTLDACSTDQFEQQVRALCGLPLAEPTAAEPGRDGEPAGRSLDRRVRRAGTRCSGAPACGCICTARPSPGRAGRWAT